jgi:hypothetical protein
MFPMPMNPTLTASFDAPLFSLAMMFPLTMTSYWFVFCSVHRSSAFGQVR